MKKEICSTLAEIEKLHNVKILYACESGSRAWGFPSCAQSEIQDILPNANSKTPDLNILFSILFYDIREFGTPGFLQSYQRKPKVPNLIALLSINYHGYFTSHSYNPEEFLSGCTTSSFTAFVFTGSKSTVLGLPFCTPYDVIF